MAQFLIEQVVFEHNVTKYIRISISDKLNDDINPNEVSNQLGRSKPISHHVRGIVEDIVMPSINFFARDLKYVKSNKPRGMFDTSTYKNL